MRTKKNRLKEAETKYCEQLHEWLTNPRNQDLPDEIVEPKIEAAFNEFIKALVQDEDECAEFISKGCVLDEMEILPVVFNHFRSEKIYEAIKSNCEVAFSHQYVVESDEREKERQKMLDYMGSVLENQ